MQCMQVLPQVYMHDGIPTSYEPGLLVQPPGIVQHGLPMLDVHTYFTECHDAHQIVVSKNGYVVQAVLIACAGCAHLLHNIT